MFNIEAETEVLGAILANDKNFLECVDSLEETDFYDSKNRKIFSFMKDIYVKGRRINEINLLEAIGKDRIGEVGGATYIGNLIEGGMNRDLTGYVEIIKKYSRRRVLKEIGQKIIKAVGKSDVTNEKIEEFIYSEMDNRGHERKKILNTEEFLYKGLEEIEKMATGAITLMSTGYKNYDDNLGGLKKGELVILAGRPSMGKTVLAVNLMVNLASEGSKVFFVEVEMKAEEVAKRIFSGMAKIKNKKLETGDLEPEDFEKLTDVFNEMIRKGNMMLDCNTEQSLLSIRARAKALKRTQGLDVVIIDYLSLIQVDKNENRNNAIGELTRGLKLLAKELDICIIAISQLSRAVEARVDKRPMLSDLRESGSIEQDADVVMFVYRENYYNKEVKSNNMELIIRKNRAGKTGTVYLDYYPEYQKIINYKEKTKVA